MFCHIDTRQLSQFFSKFRPRFYGPFKILKKISKVSYRLALLLCPKDLSVSTQNLDPKAKRNPHKDSFRVWKDLDETNSTCQSDEDYQNYVNLFFKSFSRNHLAEVFSSSGRECYAYDTCNPVALVLRKDTSL